jgi:hypothetical protein
VGQSVQVVSEKTVALDRALGVVDKNVRTVLWLTIAALVISVAALAVTIIIRVP